MIQPRVPNAAAEPATAVDVSVVLSTVNRAAVLSETLRHFAALDTDGIRWQLLVVDNGSSDTTPEVLRNAPANLPLEALHEARAGKNRALNLALPSIRGGLVVFTDDDVIADPAWLKELLRASRAWPTHGILAGRIIPRFPEGTPQWVRVHPFGEAAFSRYELAQPEGPTDQLPFGPNFAIRASVMTGFAFSEQIGPSAERNYSMGSETEFLLRLQKAGHEIVYVPSAHVQHVIQANQLKPAWLLGRSFRLGRGLTRMGLSNRLQDPLLFGIPAYLVPRLIRTWLRYRLSRPLGWQRHFDIGLEYQFLLGSLHELRLMAGETSAAPRS